VFRAAVDLRADEEMVDSKVSQAVEVLMED
jgi:hypothetical protein